MAIETGAAGAAGVVKIGGMFLASAVGAAFIAAYHPQTRRETWWRATGAGIGGVFVGGAVLKLAAHYIPAMAPPVGGGEEVLLDWITTTVLPTMFVFGGLFWGLVGMTQNLAKKLHARGADAIGGKIGL